MKKKGIVSPIIILVAIISLIIIFLAISLISALNKCTLPREPLQKVSYSWECIKNLPIFKIFIGIISLIIVLIVIKIIIKFIRKKLK